MISDKFLSMCNMGNKKDYEESEYYGTFLVQSDRRVLQHQREKTLGIKTTLSDDEFIELEQCRQRAVDEIRRLSRMGE